MQDVLDFYQRRLGEVLERNPGTEPVKIALLAGLNLADELLRLRKALTQAGPVAGGASTEIDAITRHMIEKIDAALDAE